MKIVSNKDYVAGWLDSSIHEFLEILSPSAAETKYALITCLDSDLYPAALRGKSPELKSMAGKLDVLGDGLLLPTKLLLQTNSRRRIFFGFDEVCFFPEKPTRGKTAALSLVGPARLNQKRFNPLGKWMAETSCSLVLGGGEGLNFVVRAQGLARFLLGSTIERPDPAVVPV